MLSPSLKSHFIQEFSRYGRIQNLATTK